MAFILLFIQVTFLILEIAETSNRRLPKRYTEEQVCNTAISTLVKVQACPGSNKTAHERLQKKRCQSFQPCNNEELVYHCIRYKNALAEVCAPVGIIVGNCCTQFSIGVGRVIEDYGTLCTECPFRYNSNESYKYTICTEHTKINNTEHPSTTVKNTVQTTNNGKPSSTLESAKTNVSSKSGEDANQLKSVVPIVVITVVTLLTFVLGLSGVAYMVHRLFNKKGGLHRSTDHSTTTQNGHGHPLLQ